MDVTIRMLVSMAGVDVSHKPGDEIAVRPEVAEAWIAVGLAAAAGGAPTAPPAPPAADKPLDQMKKAELVTLAAPLGIEKPDKMTVPKLVEAIQAKRGEG